MNAIIRLNVIIPNVILIDFAIMYIISFSFCFIFLLYLIFAAKIGNNFIHVTKKLKTADFLSAVRFLSLYVYLTHPACER